MPRNSRSLVAPPPPNVIFLAVSILLLIPLVVRAQVVIRDTVVISPGINKGTSTASSQAQLNPLSPLSSIAVTMPIAGNVTIEYDSAYSLTKVIDPIAHVTAKISGHTFADTSITGRLRLQNTTTDEWNFCTAQNPNLTPVNRYEYDRDTTHPSTEWQFKVFSVLPNEQVELACTTLSPTPTPVPIEMEGFVSSGPDTVGQTLVWRLYFQPSMFWTCDPAYMFNQYVYVSLVLSPDTVVRFNSLDSNTVYPYYPAIRNDTVTAGVKMRFMDMEARIAYGDSVLHNYPIRVHKPVLVDSGGHSHDGTRPLGTYRVPKVSGSGFDIIDSSFTRNTDTSGVLKFRFLASQFGGKERIKARTVSDSTKFDTLSLRTRVPGLELLPEGTNYIKYGGTCRHRGPQAPAGCTTPDNDHWGTPDLIESIIAIADSFAVYYSNYRIRVNDMSLPLGGGFDLGGNWEADVYDQYPQSGDCNDTGHCEHREGTVADISFSVLNPSGDPVPMTPQQTDRIRQIIRRIIGAPLEHGHFHIGEE